MTNNNKPGLTGEKFQIKIKRRSLGLSSFILKKCVEESQRLVFGKILTEPITAYEELKPNVKRVPRKLKKKLNSEFSYFVKLIE